MATNISAGDDLSDARNLISSYAKYQNDDPSRTDNTKNPGNGRPVESEEEDDHSESLSEWEDPATAPRTANKPMLHRLDKRKKRWRKPNLPEKKPFAFGTNLIRSLDHLTASDLSLSLYEAYWQRHGSQVLRRSDAKQAKETRSTARSMGSSRKIWTAWPLPPKRVPRESDFRGSMPVGYPYIKVPIKLSQDLQDVVTGQILKFVKLRLADRATGSANRSETPSTTEQDVEQMPSRPAEPESDQNLQTISRRIMTDDDEQASRLLRPTTQSIMSKLDHLLMGLHRARRSYLSLDLPEYQKTSQKRGRPESARSGARSRARSGTASSENGENSQQHPQTGDDSEYIDSQGSAKRRRTSYSTHDRYDQFTRRKSTLGLRDWSDVLGIALMSGFEPETIQRVRARCTSLFNEKMEFRVLQ